MTIPDPSALIAHLSRLTPSPGLARTAWTGLSVFRANEPTSRVHVIYRPCVCFVAQGQKRILLDGETITYDPLHYLVVSVALPVAAQITEASSKAPCLSMMLEFDPLMLNQVLLEMSSKDTWSDEDGGQCAAYSTPISKSILSAVNRFLDTVDSPMDRQVLGPGAAREVLYRILQGPQGDRLRSYALQNSGTFRVARAVRFIEDNLNQPLSIAAISKKMGMSESTLHHTFKSVTTLSPMQYLKKLRLYRARQMIVAEGSSVDEARSRVGYGSASQFSREFKRLFGVPPSKVSDSVLYELPTE